MEMQQIIEQAEQNIRQALKDYGRHTDQTQVLYDVSNCFIKRLAKDSSYAKQELRDLFSKSPVWDERLDALVINGTRTHNPDQGRIYDLGMEILEGWVRQNGGIWSPASDDAKKIVAFFSSKDEERKAEGLKVIRELAPKAYAPTKKLSRVFKAVCVALGIADETAGSDFQRLYAQFADELSAKKIGFKLYVSINPAHFLTMSNPKEDSRGCTLTSCHSFNSTEYDWNNGCAGYARDEVSFIVFTVDDPSVPELLNNRKTTRQIFAYKPGNGFLLQSRLYNTSGGTRGAQEDSKLYRDLVQREISMLEGAPNLWKTYSSTGEYGACVDAGYGFGGKKEHEISPGVFLTSEELRQAYEKQEHIYDLQDIEEELDTFSEEYGLDEMPVTDTELEDMATDLRRRLDENADAIWSICRSEAIEKILKDRKEAPDADKARRSVVH